MQNSNLKIYSAKQAAELVKLLSSFQKKEIKGEGDFEVIATTEGVDRDGEVISVKGWITDNFLKNPVVLFGHDYWSFPIGAVTDLKFESDKVIAKGVFARTPEGQKARLLYEDGILRAVSVGFLPKKREGNAIISAELLELSFVPVPSNPDALSLSKIQEFETMLKTSVTKKDDTGNEEKSAVPFEETPKMDEASEWSASDADKRLTEWATVEKDGEQTVDFAKYRRAFTWYNKENPEVKSSYKLPHHDVDGGELKVVWRGVTAAMGALLGARGGAEIPESDIKAVYEHLAGHYKQFEKEPPELKSYTQYELDTIFPELAEKQTPPDTGETGEILKQLKDDIESLVNNATARVAELKGIDLNNADPMASQGRKDGRTLSSKTRSLITNSVESMTKALKDLKDLLDSADAEKSSAGDVGFESLLKSLQNVDKIVEKAIVEVKQRTK